MRNAKMVSRRRFMAGAALAGAAAVSKAELAALPEAPPQASPATQPPLAPPSGRPYNPVVTLNGWRAPWRMANGWKEFHLMAEGVVRELAPGMKANFWGYNGQSPGPTIECVEGDKVRFFVTNKLPEHTTIHWHGILLPSGMDGVGGLNEPHIKPGETFVYEFTLKQHGTHMYHPHGDEMVQLAVGMMGMFIIHPKDGEPKRIDRDYCFLLHNWALHPGTYRPDPSIKTRKRVGEAVSLMGGVNTLSFINNAPAEIIQEARKCMIQAGEKGCYILGSGCVVPRDAKRENVEALRIPSERYGKYENGKLSILRDHEDLG